MDVLKELVQQNSTIAIIGALVSIFLAGVLLKRLKLLAIILLALALSVLYFLVGNNELEKINIDDIKDKVKDKVIEKLES